MSLVECEDDLPGSGEPAEVWETFCKTASQGGWLTSIHRRLDNSLTGPPQKQQHWVCSLRFIMVK